MGFRPGTSKSIESHNPFSYIWKGGGGGVIWQETLFLTINAFDPDASSGCMCDVATCSYTQLTANIKVVTFDFSGSFAVRKPSVYPVPPESAINPEINSWFQVLKSCTERLQASHRTA